MLFNIPANAAPSPYTAESMPRGVRLKIGAADTAREDPWFIEYVHTRYPTSGDAAADTNGTEVDRGPALRGFDNEQLTNGVAYWWKCYWVDEYGNKSALSSVVTLTYRGATTADIENGAVTDPKTDQTAPGTPTSLAVTQLTKDTDGGDGRIRINARATWGAPAGGVPVKRYAIEINDGENVEVRYAPAARRYIKIKDMVIGRTYNVQVSAESFSGIEGAQTTAVPITPTAKTTGPADVTSVSIVAKPTFNRVKYTPPSDKDFAGVNVYFNTVANPATATLIDFTRATKYDDTTARTIGASYYYYVEAVNKTGIVSANRVAASNNPIVHRGVAGADSNLTDPNAYAENSDFALGPNIGWSDATKIVSDVANAFRGTYVLARAYTGAASSYVNRNKLLFAVRPGEQYQVGGVVKHDGSFAHSGGNFGGWRLSFCSDILGVTEIATSIVIGPAALNTAWAEYSALVTVPATSTIAFARLEPAVYNQTAGTVYFSHGYIRPAVTDVMTDQTAPVQPAAAPTMTVLTADFDKDGKSEQGFFMNLPTWASGVPVKNWEIEHQIASAQGSSGSMTGYSKRRENALIKAEPSGNTYYQYDAMANRWHKTRYRGISFSGKEGAWSVYQNLGAQPNIYDATTGTTPATPTAIALDNAIEVSWTRPTIANYSHTELYQGATLIYSGTATKFLDKTVRTVGAGYTYTVKNYDEAGNVSNSSAASASVNFRQVQTTDIGDLQVTARKANLGNPANQMKDNLLIDPTLWVASGGTGPAIAVQPNDAAAFGSSKNFYRVTSSLAIGQALTFKSLPINPCVPDTLLSFSCYLKRYLPASLFSVTLSVEWYTLDSNGDAVFLSNSAGSKVINFVNGTTVYFAKFSEVVPSGAVFFVLKLVTQTAASATTYGFDVGGVLAIQATSLIVEETVEGSGVTVPASSNAIIATHVCNHTSSAVQVLIKFRLKNNVGGFRSVNFDIIKNSSTIHTTTTYEIQGNALFEYEVLDNAISGASSTYEIRAYAGGSSFPTLYQVTRTQAILSKEA